MKNRIELQNGYKRTKIGWVPEEWSLIKLKDLCVFRNGHGFSKTDWSTIGLPIIRIQNLNGVKDFNYYSKIPDKDWLVNPGDLLFAWAGVKGVSFGPTIWNGPKGLLNQHIYKIIPNRTTDVYWLFLVLKTVTARIERRAHGFKTNLVHVQKSDIEREILPFPPLPEQRKIAQILSTWDKAIALTEQLVAARERQKKALMQQVLTGKIRFRGFNTESWITVKIGDVLKEHNRPVKWDENTLYNLAIIRRWSEGMAWREPLYGHQIKVKKLFEVKTNDILLSEIQAAYGAIGIVPKEFNGAKVSDLYTVLIPQDNNKLDVYFFKYLSQTPHMWHKCKISSNGFFAERLRLNFQLDVFLKQTIYIPTSHIEQNRIVEILSTLDSHIEILQKKLNLLKLQKKGLMQQLLTGKIRVK